MLDGGIPPVRRLVKVEEMMDARFEVIDALVDGERVDATALKQALADAAGRDYLVDAWLLREGVQDDAALAVSAPVLPARAAGRKPWLPWSIVAAACLIAGFMAGYRMANRLLPLSEPTVIATPASTSFPVPAPTRVIQVQFGGDSSAGGE